MWTRTIEGTQPLTVTLTVFPETRLGDGGEVALQAAAGRRIVVPLPTRLFRLLRLLVEAYFEDARVESDLRGLRNAEAILRGHAAQVGDVATIRRETLRHYVTEIRTAFRRAFDEVADEPGCPRVDWMQAVIKTVGRRGSRIGTASFVFIDHTAKPPVVPTPQSTVPSTSIPF